MTNTTTTDIAEEVQSAEQQLNQLQVYVQQGGLMNSQNMAEWQEYLGERLGAAWAEAKASGDTALAEKAQRAWDATLTITDQAQVAPVAMTIANALLQQRNQAVEGLATLENDLLNQNYDNALVAGFAEVLDEERGEAAYDVASEIVYDETFESFAQIISEFTGASSDDTSLVLRELRDTSPTYGYKTSVAHQFPALTSEMGQQLASFIQQVVDAVKAIEPERIAERRRRTDAVMEWDAARVVQQQRSVLYDGLYPDLDDDGYPE